MRSLGPLDLLSFELRSSLAHFRRPDTTATHVSYPFLTRTALRGILGAILGLEAFLAEDAWTAIELLSPPKTQAQGMLLLGKGFLGQGNETFNRRTSVELVVSPHYRVWYTGEYLEELTRRIQHGQSVYPTYLGSAFALTVPEHAMRVQAVEVLAEEGEEMDVWGVLPTGVPQSVLAAPERIYGKSGAMHYRYLGGRRFEGSIQFVYEARGRPIRVRAAPPPYQPPTRLVRLPEGRVLALW